MKTHKTTKKFWYVAIGIILVLTVGFWLKVSVLDKSNALPASDKIPVTASFYTMGEFVRQIGGERVSVVTLTQPGVEPHDYEPTPQDITKIYQSKLSVYNGGGFEPWADKLKPELEKRGIAIVEASVGVELQASTDEEHPIDPHIWTNPLLAIKEVDTIKNALVKVDPAGEATYKQNAEAYVKRLQELDQAFRSGLANCQSKDIVTSHQAFGYLTSEYGLNMVPISGLSPDEEPSPQKLAEITDFVKAHNVTHIFFETLVSSKLSETIALETGAQTIAFNPLEGLTEEEVAAGKDYLSVQRDNLDALKVALHCQ